MDFIERLKLLPPEQIIESSYEKVFKEEFLITIQSRDLTKAEINALMKLNYPIDSLYREWLHTDLSYVPMLEDVADEHIEKLVKLQKRESYER
jgi:hypothetical protein